ncbi:MAG: hypothetical protein JJ974_08085 [Phycisphaerales bacterium]|nr:hypothetical protein [Phycisphaerales bacterium]
MLNHTFSTIAHRISTLSVLIWLLTLAACSSTQQVSQPSRSQPTIAMINGQPIDDSQLWPMLAEIAGDQTLQELVLTKLLDELALDRNWIITNEDLDHELTALVTTLNQAGDEQATPRLIETIRRRRGLGPVRFESLLRRNAILRRAIPSRETRSMQAEIESEILNNLKRFTERNGADPSGIERDRIMIRSALVVEQRAMERFAAQLLDSADVIVMDRSIKWSRLGEE